MRFESKKYFKLLGVIFGLVGLTATAPALGCYSGLVVIPTADTIGKGQYGIELQVDGVLPSQSSETRVINTEYGISDKMEIGVDFDQSKGVEASKLINAKFVIAKLYGANTSIAAGICNLADQSKSNPYLVATKELSACRVHFGAIHMDGKGRMFAGVDRAINDKITLMADYTNGLDNYSSFGLSYQFNSSKSLLAGVEFPNVSGDSLFTVHFVMNGNMHSRLGGGE